MWLLVAVCGCCVRRVVLHVRFGVLFAVHASVLCVVTVCVCWCCVACVVCVSALFFLSIFWCAVAGWFDCLFFRSAIFVGLFCFVLMFLLFVIAFVDYLFVGVCSSVLYLCG